MVNEIRYEKKFEKFAKKEKNMKISHKIQVKKGWLYSGAVHKKDAKKRLLRKATLVCDTVKF